MESSTPWEGLRRPSTAPTAKNPPLKKIFGETGMRIHVDYSPNQNQVPVLSKAWGWGRPPLWRSSAGRSRLSMPHAATTKGCLILCTVLGLTSNLSATQNQRPGNGDFDDTPPALHPPFFMALSGGSVLLVVCFDGSTARKM